MINGSAVVFAGTPFVSINGIWLVTIQPQVGKKVTINQIALPSVDEATRQSY